ncbi:hypothetical protein [Spirochaeta dissipatitropha]
MDDSIDFTQQLDDALMEYQEHLEAHEFPKMREEFRMFYLAFEAIYKTLKKKGLIQDDPYRFEAKVAELEIPDENNFLESERDDRMSIRLSNLDAQLDFINNYFQFSLEMLSLERIKLLAKMTQYIRWNELTDTNPNINTQSLAIYLSKIKAGGDSLSTGIIKDSVDQLIKHGKSIRNRLKNVTLWHRERYKLAIRQQITDQLDLKQAEEPANSHMTPVKRKFMSVMGDKPFYAELISEVLNEDYGPDSSRLQQELLSQLRPEKEQQVKKNIGPSFTDMLQDAIRAMSQSSRSLEVCISRLNENHYMLENRQISLTERFKRWFARKVLKANMERVYEIEYMDPATSTRRTERVSYMQFSETVTKKARLYNGILSKSGSTAAKLANANEDQLFQFLFKNLEELHTIYRRLSGLDTYFKTEMPRDERKQVQGIKNDLTALKNVLVSANQKKHDYVSKREEQEQLKKLGISYS